MTKAEMIQNIATEIILYNSSIGYDVAQIMAKKILKRMIKDGIEAPLRFKKVTEFKEGEWANIPFNQIYCHEGFAGIDVNEWE